MGNLFQLEAGSVLVERYQIVRRIGGGGMGSVYLARDKRLADAYRAVKEMIGTYSDESQRKKVVEDFERESQLLASLDHPAIPTIYDYFITEGCYYLVMKYIGGGDLQNRQKESANNIIEEQTVTEWGIQIADVLEYLHSQNPPIIYRDMKPANVMLDERDRIVLVDFGIARFVASTQKNVTAIGTMGYAPPELFAGKVEARSDIYSLGATMFHLLTGRDPQDNPLLMFDFNRNPRPKQINTKLTEEMDAILSKAVEHKPANRFSSAGEMKQVLERHLRRLKGEGAAVVVVPPQPEVTPEVSFCGQCGNKVNAENVFCPYCGAPQKQAAKPAASASSPQISAPQPATLVLFGLGNQPFSFNVTKESSLVGRLDTNRGIFPDIDLTPYDKDGKVSRRHAVIHRKGDQIMIEDLGSTNGTFVNSTVDRITPKQPFLLKSGDELRLGETTLRFYLGALPPSLNIASSNKNAPPGPSPGVVTYRSPSGQKTVVPGTPAPALPPTNNPQSGQQPKTPSAQASGAVARVDQNSGGSKPTVGAASIKNNSLNIPPVNTGRQNTDPKKLIFITNVDFTGQVRLNSIVPLQVGLLNAKDAGAAAGLASVQKLHSHDNEISINLKPENPLKEIPVDVYVAAPGFEIEPDIFTRIAAPVNGNAPPKIFQLKAVQLGSTTVTVDFYQESDYLSSVTIETVIVD